MCGIAGLFCQDAPARAETLLAMAGEFAHRGPDGVGLYLDAGIGMVDTRLSIVDLAHGDQPIADESGRFWAMQNGEIYNYLELREELTRLGRRFRTHCDTEVLAQAFAQWGPACLSRLNGDFAVAIWDQQERELFLARDRFGVRPLYLADLPGGGLGFASEIKALLRVPGARRELDPVGVVDCFVSWSTLPDRSAFEGVRELAPGTYLRLREGGERVLRTWWRAQFAPREEQDDRPEGELACELQHLLAEAARLRLRADVPVGIYLSGGLDSSIVAALARRVVPGVLRTFSLGFSDRRFDEGPYQDLVASSLDLSSERVDVSDDDIGRVFPRVVELCERPLLRTSPVPLLQLAGIVRRSGFKVVLTGEGADELFGGYDIFKEAIVRRFWARQPHSRRRPLLFRRLYPFLGEEFSRSGPFLDRFFGVGLEGVDDPLYSHAVRFRAGERLLRFLHPDVVGAIGPEQHLRHRLIARLPHDFSRWTALSKAQYLEIESFLFGYLLHAQGDRMMMGHSVEGRFPYLDHRVAEFALRLPDRMRLRGLREKHLLRVAARPLLPSAVVDRVKHPYRAPILRSFFGAVRQDYVDEMLDARHVASTGLFRADAVAKLLLKCRTRQQDGLGESDEMALVGILSTLLLHERLVRRPQLAAPLLPTRVVAGPHAAGLAAHSTRP